VLAAQANARDILDTIAVKAAYEIHLFFQPPPPVPPGMNWAHFFQRLKPDEAVLRSLPPTAMRGILKVTL
jgi:hypothetical protein